ncbi:MAG: hypothetical protein IH608_06155 [Proteobacteria bacterium]|nr:hypothetical protein [Pseudomonadota bacterium]
MGFFKKIFGGVDYPELSPQDPAARRLTGVQDALSSLAGQTRDRLEVVPGEDKAFVFVGKPPKQFGLVWVEDGKLCNLKNYLAEHGIDQQRALRLVEALSQAYEKSQDAPRYTAELAGRQFVVTSSDHLAGEVERVLERGASA